MGNKIKAALETEKLFLPSYVKKFQCQQCGCCCLSKWRIEVDPKTVQRVSQQYASRGDVDKTVGMMQQDELGRVTMCFDEQGRCKALTEDGRCQWQLEWGYEYLSDVCKVYPRIIYASSRGLEFSLSFSCSAAAAALKQAEPVTFTLEEAGTSEFFFMRPGEVAYYSPERLPATDIKTHYFLMEAGLIRIMQDRNYTIGERLILLGRTLGRLAALNGSAQTTETVIAALAPYKEAVILEKDYELHLQTLKKVFEELIKRQGKVLESLNFLLKAARLSEEHSIQDFWSLVEVENPWLSVAEYEKLLQKQLPKGQEWFSTIMENYFVNFIFSKPFYLEEWQQTYFKMALLHGLIQFITVCLRSWQEEEDPQEMLLLAVTKADNLISHSHQLIPDFWKGLQTLTDLERHTLVSNLAKG